jgi:DNA-binding SARP family transcriptional activator
LVRRRRRQHRIPGDPSTSESSQPPLPAAAEAVEAAWLATRRQAHDPDSHHSYGEYFADGDENLDDQAQELIAAAPGDRSDPELNGDDLGDDLGLTNGLPGGLGESLLVASPHPAAVNSAAATTMPRGETAGGEPAPTLLALTGPPTAAVMAEAAWFGGVGLIGPGAAGAARAVLTRLLTGSGPMGGVLLTTEETVAELLPAGAAEGFSVIPGVTVFATTAAALTAADAELLGRNRRLDDAGVDTLTDYRRLPDGEPVPAVLLLAHTPSTPGLTTRAAAGLNLGRDREVGAVWLGSWQPATITVTTTGALAFTDAGSPVGQAENLLPADTADLLAALLPGVRDALDVLDPATLATHTDHESTAVDEDGAAAEAAAAAPAELPAGGDGDRWGLGGSAVLDVAVLGRVRVTVVGGGEVTGLRAKVRELLALLAVHPDGLSTDQISEALWPGAPPGRASNRLSPILAQTRRLLREAAHRNGDPTTNPDQDQDPNSHSASAVDLLPLTDGRYRLHPALLDTDYRRFTAALAVAADARSGSGDGDESYRAALQAAARLYRGEPFDGADYGWAEPIRESLRRQATDVLAALAESLTPDSDNNNDPGVGSGGRLDRPDMNAAEALTALERAVEVDPYNEELYRRIMRLHGAAGRRDAVRRTLRLLEARLLDLDTDPDPATLALAADLLRPRRSRTAAGRDGGTRT